MIIDSPILEFLEKKITHPIQRNYHVTNFWIARWFSLGVMLTFSLLLFGGFTSSSLIFADTIENPSVFDYIAVFIFYFFTLAYFFWWWQWDEKHFLKCVENKIMNTRKINILSQALRILTNVNLSVGVLQVIFLKIYLALLFAFMLALVIYFVCLDPIPRSKEKQKIPKGIVLES